MPNYRTKQRSKRNKNRNKSQNRNHNQNQNQQKPKQEQQPQQQPEQQPEQQPVHAAEASETATSLREVATLAENERQAAGNVSTKSVAATATTTTTTTTEAANLAGNSLSSPVIVDIANTSPHTSPHNNDNSNTNNNTLSKTTSTENERANALKAPQNTQTTPNSDIATSNLIASSAPSNDTVSARISTEIERSHVVPAAIAGAPTSRTASDAEGQQKLDTQQQIPTPFKMGTQSSRLESPGTLTTTPTKPTSAPSDMRATSSSGRATGVQGKVIVHRIIQSPERELPAANERKTIIHSIVQESTPSPERELLQNPPVKKQNPTKNTKHKNQAPAQPQTNSKGEAATESKVIIHKVLQESTPSPDRVSVGNQPIKKQDPIENKKPKAQTQTQPQIAGAESEKNATTEGKVIIHKVLQEKTPSPDRESVGNNNNKKPKVQTQTQPQIASAERTAGKVIIHKFLPENAPSPERELCKTQRTENTAQSPREPQGESQAKVVIHRVLQDNKVSTSNENIRPMESSRGKESDRPKPQEQGKVIIHHVYLEEEETETETEKEEEDEERGLLSPSSDRSGIQIQEVSDASLSDYNENQPLVSEAESETEGGVCSPTMERSTQISTIQTLPLSPSDIVYVTSKDKSRNSPPREEDVKQRRVRTREALEAHFRPQFLSPRYLDSITEENSDMSDARSDCSTELGVATATNNNHHDSNQEQDVKAKRANAVFPKSNLDFSKKHKHGPVPKAPLLPAAIREEPQAIAVVVATKFVDQLSAAATAAALAAEDERSERVSSDLAPEAEAAEVVYINSSASSSASDLRDLESWDEDSTEAEYDLLGESISLDTDVSEIIAKPRQLAAETRLTTDLVAAHMERNRSENTAKERMVEVEVEREKEEQDSSRERTPVNRTSTTPENEVSNLKGNQQIDATNTHKQPQTQQQQLNFVEGMLQKYAQFSNNTQAHAAGSTEPNAAHSESKVSTALTAVAAMAAAIAAPHAPADHHTADGTASAENSNLANSRSLRADRNVQETGVFTETVKMSEIVREQSDAPQSAGNFPIPTPRAAPTTRTTSVDPLFQATISPHTQHKSPSPPPIPPPPTTTTLLSDTHTNTNPKNNPSIPLHDFKPITSSHLTSVGNNANASASLLRQESAESHCSDSTSHSQCTAINVGGPLSPHSDFDVASPIAEHFDSWPTTSTTPTPTGTTSDDSQSPTAIKKLRLLCAETVASMPYGEEVLEELATVSQNIGEVNASKAATHVSANAMPYPLPDLPHIDALQLSLGQPSLQQSNQKLVIKQATAGGTRAPPPSLSPSPPPVPAPPRKELAGEEPWLGMPTEADPKLLVCLSPAQQSYMSAQAATQADQPDQLLDAHQKFVERRGYHEYSADQVQAMNSERAEEQRILETAAIMKKLRKSLTPTPPPIPPPPVPVKSSETAAKAQQQSQQAKAATTTTTTTDTTTRKTMTAQQSNVDNYASNEKSSRAANEQSAAAAAASPSGRAEPTAAEHKNHRLLAIIHDTAQRSSLENSSRQALVGQQPEPLEQQAQGTAQRVAATTSQKVNTGEATQTADKMQGIEQELNKMFPTMGASNIFDEAQRRYSNIESSSTGRESEFCSQLRATQPKRYSSIETSSFEAKKRLENGQVVYDYATQQRQSQHEGDPPLAASSAQNIRPADLENIGKSTVPPAAAAATTNAKEIMSAFKLKTEDPATTIPTTPTTPTKRTAATSEPHASTAQHSQPADADSKYRESLRREYIKNRQMSENIVSSSGSGSMSNKDISGTYEEFRQRAKAAAEALPTAPTAPVAEGSTLNSSFTATSSGGTSFDREKLFQDFDELSQQLKNELELGKAKRRMQYEKATSLYDLSRMPSEFKDEFEQLKRSRHEHMQELEREIERSMRSRQTRLSQPRQVVTPTASAEQHQPQAPPRVHQIPIQLEQDRNLSKTFEIPINLDQTGEAKRPPRTFEIPVHIEGATKATNDNVNEPKTYEISVHIEPPYRVSQPVTPQNMNYRDEVDNVRYNRAESMYELSAANGPATGRPRSLSVNCGDPQSEQSLADDWWRYASDFGDSENIARPLAKEVEICYQRQIKPNTIRAPRLTVSTSDLSSSVQNYNFDSHNAYAGRRMHAPMLSEAPQKARPLYQSCYSVLERDPNPTYITTTSRRGVSPAPPVSPQPQSQPTAATGSAHDAERQKRRSSLPREIQEQQLKYIFTKEEELRNEVERLQNERLRLLQEMSRPQAAQQPSAPPQRLAREHYRATPRLPPLSEDEVFRQQMAEEWLSAVAEREKRRLQKIIKISKVHQDEARQQFTQNSNASQSTNISEEFLDRVKERRSKLAMPADSDWESGAESQPVTQGQASETEEPPSVKVFEGKAVTDYRQLPKHLREFARFSNHQNEKIDDGHRELHEEEERRQEASGNSVSSAVKKSSMMKTVKISTTPSYANGNAIRPKVPPPPTTYSTSTTSYAAPSNTSVSSSHTLSSSGQEYADTDKDRDSDADAMYALPSPSFHAPSPQSPFFSKLPASFGAMFATSPFRSRIYEEFDKFWTQHSYEAKQNYYASTKGLKKYKNAQLPPLNMPNAPTQTVKPFKRTRFQQQVPSNSTPATPNAPTKRIEHNRRSWSESDLLKEIDKELKLAKGFLFADEQAQSTIMFAPKFKAKAASGPGVWSPKSQTPTSSINDLNEESAYTRSTPPPPPPPTQPIWTPEPSPSTGRKEFRPVRFESPTLPRRYILEQNSTSTPAIPPWSDTTNEQISTTLSPRSINSCTNLSTTTTLGSSSINPYEYAEASRQWGRSSNVSDKVKTFERSASASELYRPFVRRQQDASRAIYRPNEVIYKVKHEYMSEPETEHEHPRKMAQLGRRQFDGIGPVTNDGMPIILRSEVKEPHQHEWYKRLYQTIHKQKNNAGRHQYKNSGYQSEPEPTYDSDYSIVKYRTLDRRRLEPVSSAANVRSEKQSYQSDKIYGTMPNPIKSGQLSYKNQPGRIENYVTGHSSVSEKERKEWWDEVMDIFNGWLREHTPKPRIYIEFVTDDENNQLEQTKLSPHYTEGNLSRALAKESGYTSDSNLVFRRKEIPQSSPLSPVEQKQFYRSVQAGGEPPLFGFRKPAPEKPRSRMEQDKYEYYRITPNLTKIRISRKDIVEEDKKILVKPIRKAKSQQPVKMYAPSFISLNAKSDAPPPPPHRRSSVACVKSSKSSTTVERLAKPIITKISSRHERCFQSPDSNVSAPNKYGTITLRKRIHHQHSHEPPICRSKSAGAVSTLLSQRHAAIVATKRSGSPGGGAERLQQLTRLQQHTRLRSLSPQRRQPRVDSARQESRSPVAFGRSISKERTFAEEKKRLENALPRSRTTFEASTNILRDPALKSPQDVKQAMRSYATCSAFHGRSKSLPRCMRSVLQAPKTTTVSTTMRHSICQPQVRPAHVVDYAPKANVKATTTPSRKIATAPIKTVSTPSASRKFDSHSVPRVGSSISVASTTTHTHMLAPKNGLTTAHTLKTQIKIPAKGKAPKPRPTPSIGSGRAIQSSKSDTQICRKAPPKAAPKQVTKVDVGTSTAAPPTLNVQEVRSSIVALDDESLYESVHDRTTFWNEFNAQQTQPAFKPRTVSPSSRPPHVSRVYLTDELHYSDADQASEFGESSCIEDLVWQYEQRSKATDATGGRVRAASKEAIPPRTSSPIATPTSAVHANGRQFSPTREVRVPQTPRQVRSPSRRKIDSCRTQLRSETQKIIRASSLSSADERPKHAGGLYHCAELAHSATSLAQHERHSPTCRYRNNSERFTDLNRFYSTLERVGQLERATSLTNFKPIRKDSELLDFEEWRKLRLHERAEKELHYLVHKLKQEQRDKDLVFRAKDVEDVKWRHEHDFGLHAKEKSVEDLRESFERKGLFQQEAHASGRDQIHRPYWRRNTVADLASSVAVKLQPEATESTKYHLSNHVVSTLSKEQLQKVTQQLNEIYSNGTGSTTVPEEYIVTVEHESKYPLGASGSLKVRSNSSITKEDLMGTVMRKKELRSKALAQQQQKSESDSGSIKEITKGFDTKMRREQSPVLLARETFGAVAAQNAEATLKRTPKVPPLPKEQHSFTAGDREKPPDLPKQPSADITNGVTTAIAVKVVSEEDELTAEEERQLLGGSAAGREKVPENISKKIQYFEDRQYEETPKTIYHAREDSSPDEQELMRLIEENMQKRAKDRMQQQEQQAQQQHRELTSSLTDLKDIYGERHVSRVNFYIHTPSPTPPPIEVDERHEVTVEEVSERDDADDFSPHSSLEVYDSYYRSRSLSPQSQASSSYLQRVHTGEVQKLKEKFESLDYQKSTNPFFGISSLRKVRSDPELKHLGSGSKDALQGDTAPQSDDYADVCSLTHKFEGRNQRQRASADRGRRRHRYAISPSRERDRYMPHIDIISKTAALKEHSERKSPSRSISPTRSHSSNSGIVERIRSRYEVGGSTPTSSQYVSASNPDICQITQHLTADWIAHKYPSPDTYATVPRKPKKPIRASSHSPPRPPKSLHHQRCGLKSHQHDIFANQPFDPKKHQPKARYVPDGAEVGEVKKKTPQLPTRRGGKYDEYRKAMAVTFKDHESIYSVPVQHTKGGKVHEPNENSTELPNRYLESDVNIHFKTPVRHEFKHPIPEEELAVRQAEQMQHLYQEERRRKYLQELQDMNARRHTDNFTPSQKSPIPLNRYDDFQSDLAPKSPPNIPTYRKAVARALFNFQGQNAKELSFRKGDIIYIRRQIDKNWYEGEYNAMIGLLPVNYVEIISKEAARPQANKRPTEGQARAKYNFQAQSGVELSLNKGELVTLTRRVDDNWFEGKIANRKGIFPVSYVEVLTDIGAEDHASKNVVTEHHSTTHMRPSLDTLRTNINNEFNLITQNGHQPPNGILKDTRSIHKTDILHVDTSSEPLTYRALYKYRPQNSDELELLEGDVVHVLEKCDDGWFVGTSQRTGCFGTFPGNYVERI